MPTLASTESAISGSEFTGDPNCPICGGKGFVHRDLPISHPDFGKLQICVCSLQTARQTTYMRLFRMSNLEAFKDKTFDTFNPKGRVGLRDEEIKNLQYALNQAKQFAQRLEGWIFISGGYGCGKSHLAAAIANQAVSMGVPTLFLTVPDLLDWLRFGYDDDTNSFEERFEEIRSISLLVLDDLGTQNATAWAQEKLYQLINSRYVNHLATVITANPDISEIEGRIGSRLEDPDVVIKVKIIAPDFRSPFLEKNNQNVISSLALYNSRTFGNFSLREDENLPTEERHSLEKAFRSAQQYAENPHGWLVLMGTYGTGKTHLAAAIGNYNPATSGDEPVFVVVPDLLDHLRATFSPNSATSYDRLFNEVRNARLLILDDLGTQSATPWAREKLYQILNYRYIAELPTVITTASTFDEIDPRIRSRMQDARVCKINIILVPPYTVSTFKTNIKPRKTKRSG